MTARTFFAHELSPLSVLSSDKRKAARRRYFWRSASLLSLLCLAMTGSPSRIQKPLSVYQPPAARTSASRIADLTAYRNEPLSFEPNRGQAPADAQFVARTSRSNFLLLRDGLIVTLSKSVPSRANKRDRRRLTAAPAHRVRTVHLNFSGVDPKATLVGNDELPAKTNYYPAPTREILPAGTSAGRNSERQPNRGLPIENIPNFKRVVEKELYPGIDLVYHSTSGELEYDFVVAPHTKTDQIRLKFSGVEQVKVSSSGDLLLHTQAGDLKQLRPRVFESTANGDREIKGGYVLLASDEVGFRLEDRHTESGVEPCCQNIVIAAARVIRLTSALRPTRKPKESGWTLRAMHTSPGPRP